MPDPLKRSVRVDMDPVADTTGLSKDVGWTVGVSKTLPYTIETVWAFLTSPAGIAIWLGPGAVLNRAKGSRFQTTAGAVGDMRSYRDLDRVRVSLRPAGWDHVTTVQVALQDKQGQTMIRFHQEWLVDAAERGRQRQHWTDVLAAFTAAIAKR